jgi:hypothetical protein
LSGCGFGVYFTDPAEPRRDSNQGAAVTTEERRGIERRIVESVVDAALAAGYRLNVDNGGDVRELLAPSADRAAVLAVMFATGDEHLLVFRKTGKMLGWVHLVYGNSGHDVVADHTAGVEPLLAEAGRIADRYAAAE